MKESFLNRLERHTIHASDELKSAVSQYGKKLAQFAHAPVSLKHYKRMLPFASNKELVAVVFKVLQENGLRTLDFSDVKKYYYSIALISIAEENRCAHLAFLEKLAKIYIVEHKHSVDVLHRNMLRLHKEYPDLLPIKQLLENSMV